MSELKGKYAQLRDDLIQCKDLALTIEDNDDGGTCNFDAPAIVANRWKESLVQQAAKEAGLSAFKWRPYRNTMFVFGVPGPGQGNMRTRKAEAMTAYLKSKGYDAIMYCQMD